MLPKIIQLVKNRPTLWFLCTVLLFVNLYSISTLTTKPSYWYDDGINVELAHNFADFGQLDLIIAPNIFSRAGATVGSTGYPITLPLAIFFKIFGFGLAQARIYMLLWMNALLLIFFFIVKKMWSSQMAYSWTLLIVSFAPFYGNGRSVMGEIPGFLFFLSSFYFLEQRKWWQSGLLLGLAVVSKPSIFVFLIPAYMLTLLFSNGTWRLRCFNLLKLGASSFLALLPWLVIYVEEVLRGGLGENIFNHFKNPYAEAGVSALTNIGNNLPTLVTSTTLLYMWVLLLGIIVALFLERDLFWKHKNLLIITATYLPLALLQYLKSFGYLRYLIAAEFLIFILFLIALPVLVRRAVFFWHVRFEGDPGNDREYKDLVRICIHIVVLSMVSVQMIHLFLFSDIYPSEKTQKTMHYISREYPREIIGVYNVPQVGSLLPADKKYQYLSTYGLWDFGTRILHLSPDKLPNILVTQSEEEQLSEEEKTILKARYQKDTRFTDGFSIYIKR